MKFDIITIFPKIFNSYFNESIIKRAIKKKLIKIKVHNLRDFVAQGGTARTERGQERTKYQKVDDRPFGGGPGMVIQIQPVIKAVEFVKSKIPPAPRLRRAGKNQKSKIKVILFTPGGKQFNNKIASQLVKNYEHLILICGRYEGIDARIKQVVKDQGFKIQEFSAGPYVLTGGELPAMILIDTVSRQISGVLGKKESLEEKRLGIGMPTYTRPEVFIWKNKKYAVPKILLSGNHQKIAAWRSRSIKNKR